jgi:hypothetical protein
MDQIDLKVKAISSQILVLEEQKRTLWTERNALTPLCRLNDDIIVRITEELQDPFELNNVGSHAWIQFSHVCMQLRKVITGAPLLWRNVNFTKASWAALYIQLASTVPIRAYLNGPFDEDSLSSVAENLEQLYISSSSSLGDQREWLDQFLDTSLPRMQRFECGEYDHLWLSDSLFGGSAHALTHLDITSALIDADGLDLPALTTLELHMCRLEDGLPTLFRLFSKAPQITDLTLEYLQPLTVEFVTAFSPVAPTIRYLPALRQFLFEDRGDVIQTVLPQLPNPLESLHVIFRVQPVLDLNEIDKFFLQRIIGFSSAHCTGLRTATVRGTRSPFRVHILDKFWADEELVLLAATVTNSALVYTLGLGELKTVAFSLVAIKTLLSEPEFWGRDVLPKVQKIKIEKADRMVINEDLKGQLIAWLIERSNRGRRIRTLHLEGQNMDRLDGWIGEIRQSNLVDEVEGILVA